MHSPRFLQTFQICILTRERPKCVSHSVMSNSVISWTVAHQAPLSIEFSRKEYWSGLLFLFPGDLLNPTQRLNLYLLHCGQILLPSEPPGKPRERLKEKKKIRILCLLPFPTLSRFPWKQKGESTTGKNIPTDFS